MQQRKYNPASHSSGLESLTVNRANAKVQPLPKKLVAGFMTIVILSSGYAVASAVSCCFQSLAASYDAADVLGSRVEPSQ